MTEERMGSSAPLPDESWNPPVIPTERPSDAPTVADESKIPEGKEPEVFDTPNAMNVPEPTATFMDKMGATSNE